jgi:hypothetical protein
MLLRLAVAVRDERCPPVLWTCADLRLLIPDQRPASAATWQHGIHREVVTLKPRYQFTCWSESCAHRDQEVEYADDKDQFHFVYSSGCPRCYGRGSLRVVHGGMEAQTCEPFFAIVKGMIAEHKVLKKLIDRGVADPEDQNRHDEIVAAIGDLDCSHCNRGVLSHQH